MGDIRVNLPYGRDGFLELSLPEENLIQVVEPRAVDPVADEFRAVQEALEDPIGFRDLADALRNADSLAIVVDDITRPTPTRKALDPLLDFIRRAGGREKAITIVFATGSHRSHTREEHRYLVGEEVAQRYRLVDHQATNESAVVDLGVSSSGLPVILNRHAAHADLRILVGFIKPHHIAGYAGGAKSLLPGVAGLGTILALHNFKNTAHPGCSLGVIESNPFRTALEEASKERIRPSVVLNLVSNRQKQILYAVAGDQIEAHRRAVELFDQVGRIPVKEQADVAVVACGFPSDISLYQGLNGSSAPVRLSKPILKPGGTIILVGRFYEGIGAQGFENLVFGAKSPEDLLRKIETSPRPLNDQGAAQQWIQVISNYRVIVVSDGLSEEVTPRFWCRKSKSLAEALREAGVGNGARPRVVVFPEAPYTIAELQAD